MSDAFPEEIKLTMRGDYYLLLFIKHNSIELLESLTDLSIYLERKISKISLKVFDNLHDLSIGGSEFKSRKLRKGESINVFVAFPRGNDKIPKQSSAGDVLIGSVSYMNRPASLSGASVEPTAFTLQYIIPAVPEKDKKTASGSADTKDSSSEKDLIQKLEESVFSSRIKELKKLAGKSVFDSIYPEVVAKASTFSLESQLDLHEVYVKHLEHDSHRITMLSKLISVCDEGLAKLDLTSLSAHIGLRASSNKENEVELNKEKKLVDRKKAFVIEMLHSKLKALIEDSKANPGISREETIKKVGSSYYQLEQWTDVTTSKYIISCLEFEMIQKNFGKALKLGLKLLTEKVSSDVPRAKVADIVVKVVKELGWDSSYLDQWKRNEFVDLSK
jgi:hypothetical protein